MIMGIVARPDGVSGRVTGDNPMIDCRGAAPWRTGNPGRRRSRLSGAMGNDAQPGRLTAEQRARALIDAQLQAAGWHVPDRRGMNLFAGQGVAVRELVMSPGHGRADYLLYVDKRAVGVIEAKPEGTPLSGVEWQWARYAEGLPADVRLKALTGRLDLSTVARIRVLPSKADALRLQPGDVQLNEGGDRDKLARGWIWEDQIDGCIHQNHVFRARVRDGVIEPRLLSWTANTLGGRWAERNGKQSVNLASISLSKIRQMPAVPLPPRSIQPQLVDAIQTSWEAAVRVDQAVQAQAVRSAALRRAILAAAFSGRLTGRASDVERVEDLATAGTGT
jgi:hypothetical protein